jgi:hypothetical protein
VISTSPASRELTFKGAPSRQAEEVEGRRSGFRRVADCARLKPRAENAVDPRANDSYVLRRDSGTITFDCCGTALLLSSAAVGF